MEVEWLVHENGFVRIDEMAEELDISHGTVHHMIHDILQYHKVSARWVPRQLSPDSKECSMDVCEMLLRRYEAESDDIQHIVTGDEYWIHYAQLKTKRASKKKKKKGGTLRH